MARGVGLGQWRCGDRALLGGRLRGLRAWPELQWHGEVCWCVKADQSRVVAAH